MDIHLHFLFSSWNYGIVKGLVHILNFQKNKPLVIDYQFWELKSEACYPRSQLGDYWTGVFFEVKIQMEIYCMQKQDTLYWNQIAVESIVRLRKEVVLGRKINKPAKVRLRWEASQVRQILNDWDPIPGSPTDEYDCLVDGVISALHRGAMYSDLTEFIHSEFRDHFGMTLAWEDAALVAQRIVSWWDSSADRAPHT